MNSNISIEFLCDLALATGYYVSNLVHDEAHLAINKFGCRAAFTSEQLRQ